jgi:hypothetical protein
VLDRTVVSFISVVDAKKKNIAMSKQNWLTTDAGALKKFVTAAAGSIKHFLAFSQVITAEDARALLLGHGLDVFGGDHPPANRPAEQKERSIDDYI